MRYLQGLKGGPRSVELERKGARTAYALPPGSAGRPYKDGWNIERAIREGLGASPWLFRAVHSIADNQARLPFRMLTGGDQGKPIPNHPLVPLFNFRPNEDESAYSFRYRMSAQVLLSKKGCFVELVRSRGSGDPVQAFLLDPSKTFPVPGTPSNDPKVPKNTRLVDHFEVELGGGDKEQIDPDNVLWIKLPHPTKPLEGMTPLEAAGLDVDTNRLARLYNRTFLENDGRPGGIVGVKGEFDEDTKEELEDRWNGGHRGAGRISVIEADGLDFVDTAVTPRDAQYIEGMKLGKEAILGAFGTPETVALANASGRTFDNADAEWLVFWVSTMFGHLALLGDGVNQADDDPDTFANFDTSGIEVLQRAEAARRKEMREEVAAGLRTLDSYLEATGQKPLSVPASRSYFQAMGQVPYATEGEDAPILTLVQGMVNEAATKAIEAFRREGVVPPFRYAVPRSDRG